MLAVHEPASRVLCKRLRRWLLGTTRHLCRDAAARGLEPVMASWHFVGRWLHKATTDRKLCRERRHMSSVTANPVPSAFVRLGSFVRRLGPEPPATRLASYVQRLRGYGFDCSPILRKFVACGVALTEDMVRAGNRRLSRQEDSWLMLDTG